jgi:3-oxoacyl-[acyl-carrier protein] reductase
MRLNGMTAVMTGGASGIGESMVYALAKEGASMVVVDRNINGANTVVSNVEKQGDDCKRAAAVRLQAGHVKN